MNDFILIVISVIGWIVLGILIPTVKHFFSSVNKKIERIENFINGGKLMTFEDHSEICKEVNEKISEGFCKKIDEIMRVHKEWLEERIRRLESEMKLYVKNIHKNP